MRLTEEFLVRAHNKTSKEYLVIEDILKGKEIDVPPHFATADKDGNIRTKNRVKWWIDPEGRLHGDFLFNCPDGLKDQPLPADIHFITYGEQEPPVFFGHYWLKDEEPSIIASNIVCLDYSVAREGSLVAYRWNSFEKISNKNFYPIPSLHAGHQESTGNSREMLVVHLDDHAIFSKGFEKAIISKLPGYLYYHFPDPNSALSFIYDCHKQNTIVDAVITDFNHTGMNGFHFANQVRFSEIKHGLNRTPIVMISMTDENKELIQEGLKSKVITRFFSKSASTEELLGYFYSLPKMTLPPDIPLRDAVLNLDIPTPCQVLWVFSKGTYSNTISGRPSVESGESTAAFLKNLTIQLGGCKKVYIHEQHRIGVEVLPIRGNLALIDNGDRRGHIIWFDDGKSDVMESLGKVVMEVGFRNVTEPFAW